MTSIAGNVKDSNRIEIIDSVNFKYGRFELRADNIMTYEPELSLRTYTMPHVIELLEHAKALTKGKPVPTFFNNIRLTESPTPEVKKYTMEHLKDFSSVCAMTEASAITRFMVHSFMFVYRQGVPIKMFKTKEDAIVWLQNFGA